MHYNPVGAQLFVGVQLLLNTNMYFHDEIRKKNIYLNIHFI